jgi:hypothetical protein
MANLRLRIKNNKANEIAYQVFCFFLELDMRTMEDKLADIEGLKVQLLKGLQTATDGRQALEAVGQLTPDQIVFAYQQLDNIVSGLAVNSKWECLHWHWWSTSRPYKERKRLHTVYRLRHKRQPGKRF